jgi:hypothetical protein
MVSSGLLRRVALVRSHEPHGVTTQKTPFFIVNAVKTSNLIKDAEFLFLSYKRTMDTVKPTHAGS